jgi:hypothetical protein
VNLRNVPQWPNKHLLLPLIKDRWKSFEETPRLKALVKQVTELCRLELEACDCAKEFILRRICPLGHRERLAFECMRFTDLSRNPSAGMKP